MRSNTVSWSRQESVASMDKRSLCHNCRKFHIGECLIEANVCYHCKQPERWRKNLSCLEMDAQKDSQAETQTINQPKLVGEGTSEWKFQDRPW